MKSRFTTSQILEARRYWKDLSYTDLFLYWKHYTTGKGSGSYSSVDANTSFADYLVLSATESAFERAYDL